MCVRMLMILLAVAGSLLILFPSEVTARPAQASASNVIGEVKEYRIPSEQGVMLAATLRLPNGSGRHPVLIIQTGTGAAESGGYVKLERRLNSAGIATIEFDKRGVGQSTGTFTDTMQDMQTDLVATIAWLRSRSDIDSARIALLGHSQGAAAAPIVAERDGRLAAIILLAGPVGERGNMFIENMRRQLIESKIAPDLADRLTVATRIWMESRSRGATAFEIASARSAVVAAFGEAGFEGEKAERATMILDSAQLLSMYEAAPGSALARLRIPVLAIFGARDEIIGDQSSAAASFLGENPDALVIEVPGANHSFGHRRVDAPLRDKSRDGSWMSLLPETLIKDWLLAKLALQ
jgi:uncharacterized protein